jgi:hypothetical protein
MRTASLEQFLEVSPELRAIVSLDHAKREASAGFTTPDNGGGNLLAGHRMVLDVTPAGVDVNQGIQICPLPGLVVVTYSVEQSGFGVAEVRVITHALIDYAFYAIVSIIK